METIDHKFLYWIEYMYFIKPLSQKFEHQEAFPGNPELSMPAKKYECGKTADV